jgi:hypothetical protein
MEVAYTGRKESGGNLSVSPDRLSSPKGFSHDEPDLHFAA